MFHPSEPASLTPEYILPWIFWGALLAVGYTYIGYVGWLWVRGHWSPRPVRRGPISPSITVVMVVRNEAAVLESKLEDLLALNYPADQLEILVVSDGSTDATNLILARHAENSQVCVILNPLAQGKAAGLNQAMKVVRGEIVVFTDARQKMEAEAVRLLLENFADPEVGCASGELMLGNADPGEEARGMGMYWKIEKMIREMESLSGSTVGATGAFYAVRRQLLEPLPPETILDDVYIPMNVVRLGFRVVFSPRARVWDLPSLGTRREFARKVRTLSGNYQLLRLAPWLLTGVNPVRFEFVSHKLFRLAIPFALIAALASSLLLVRHPIYKFALVLQLGFYGLSLLGLAKAKLGPLVRFADTASTFVLLNAAAFVAFVNFITGRKAAWIR
jgi:biofilm PGA synthesis N-glycosyltransferase PgaC